MAWEPVVEVQLRPGDKVYDASGTYVFGVVVRVDGIFVEADWYLPELGDKPIRGWMGIGWVRKV